MLEHEISEGALGRVSSLGVYGIASVAEWAPMDFFRYDANGAFDPKYDTGQPIYFSATAPASIRRLRFSSTTAQPEEISPTGSRRAQTLTRAIPSDPAPDAGANAALSATDLQVMEALGWTPPSELAAGSTLELSSPTASRGGSDELTFSVVNNGLGTSRSFEVGIYLSDGLDNLDVG